MHRLLVAALFLSGCHFYFADDDDGGNPGQDGGGPEPDAGADLSDARTSCDPVSVLPDNWQPVASVSAGEVTTEVVDAASSTFQTALDASAGGGAGQATEPYLYLRFDCEAGAVAVELDDESAFESTEWDIAFKRFSIRSNGGDSGPGAVGVAQVLSPELLERPDPPTDYRTDDWTAADCSLMQDDRGAPRTRFSSWYRVEGGRFVPRDLVYYVRLTGDRAAQVDIQDYYAGPGEPSPSGWYRLRYRLHGC